MKTKMFDFLNSENKVANPVLSFPEDSYPGMSFTIFNFIIIFAIYLAFCLIFGTRGLYYDAQIYWRLSGYFFPDNFFTFNQVGEAFRGYSYPYMLAAARKAGEFFFKDAYLGVWTYNSFLSAILSTAVFPLIFGVKLTKTRLLSGSIFVTACVLYFWNGLVTYPLSDIPAFTLYLLCAFIMLKSLQNKLPLILLFAFTGGALLYIAYNVRTVYLLPSFLIFILYTLLAFKKLVKTRLPYFILSIVLVIAGWFFAASPQIAINKRLIDKSTPFLQTKVGKHKNLYLAHLLDAKEYQRYETYADPGCCGWLFFKEPASNKIILPAESNYTNFIKTLIKYPIEYISIYTRHLLSLSTPIYPEIYVKKARINFVPMFILNFGVFSIALLSLLSGSLGSGHNINYGFFIYFICLFPGIMVIPALEPRFFIPVHVTLYGLLAFTVDYKILFGYIRRNITIILPFIFLAFLAWFSVIHNLFFYIP